jgi:ribosome biogenesis GTPase A
MLPRSIRVAVIGYPNVGKSALINKLIGRKIAKSKNLPGVTKRLQVQPRPLPATRHVGY